MSAVIKIKLSHYLLMITVGALSIINIAKAENKIIASVKITLENCHLKGIKAQVKCAKLTVPENYQQSNGWIPACAGMTGKS